MAYQKYYFVCNNQKAAGKTCCGAERGTMATQYIKTQLQAEHAWGAGKCRVSATSCLGRCAEGPGLVVFTQGEAARWYRYPDEGALAAILAYEQRAEAPEAAALYRLPDEIQA